MKASSLQTVVTSWNTQIISNFSSQFGFQTLGEFSLRLWGNALDNCIKWSLGPPVDCCCSDWALGSFPLTVAASGPSKVLVLCGLEQLLSSVQLADCLLRCRNNFILSIGQADCCSVLSPGKCLRTADVIGLSAISY